MKSVLTMITPDDIINSLTASIGHYELYIEELKRNHRGQVTEMRIQQIQEQIAQLENERKKFERLKEEKNDG